MTTQITIRLHDEYGPARILDLVAGLDGRSLRAVDPLSDPTADAAYVVTDIDDLAAQLDGDGHWLDGYLD